MVRMTLNDFINTCGITEITSDNIFFHPNIPKSKLDNSLSHFGQGIEPEDVIALIDNTLFGSGKKGVILTENALILSTSKVEKPILMSIDNLRTISCNSNEVMLNEKAFYKLSYPGVNELKYFFSTINEYVGVDSDVHSTNDKYQNLETETIVDICNKYIYPKFLSEKHLASNNTHSSFLARKPAYTPNYYVGKRIPKKMIEMARFLLSIPEGEKIIAFVDLSLSGQNGLYCMVITSRGLHNRDPRGENQFINWSELKELKCVSYFKYSRYLGIEFDNGRTFIFSVQNAIVKPFGLELIGDLISSLNRNFDSRENMIKDTKKKRIEDIDFQVALSFPGEKREYVSEVYGNLTDSIEKDNIFYDYYFQSQLAKPNLDSLLQKIYRHKSKLVVVFISKEYSQKDWCGLEWRAVKDIIKCREDRVMIIRFDDSEVEGLFSTDGYIDANKFTANEVANFIKERVELL